MVSNPTRFFPGGICVGQPKVSPPPIKIDDFKPKSDAEVLANSFVNVIDPSKAFEELRKAQSSFSKTTFRMECKAWLNFCSAKDKIGSVLKLEILQQRNPSFARVVKNYELSGDERKGIPEARFTNAVFTDVLTPNQHFLVRQFDGTRPTVDVLNHHYYNAVHMMLRPWRLNTVRYGTFDLDETVDLLENEWKRDKQSLVVKKSNSLIQFECAALNQKLVFDLNRGGLVVYSERTELSFHTCVESRYIKVGDQWTPREVLYKQYNDAATRVRQVYKLTFFEHQPLDPNKAIAFDIGAIAANYRDKRFRLGPGDRLLKGRIGKPGLKVSAGPENLFLGLVGPNHKKRYFILATIPEAVANGKQLSFEVRDNKIEDWFEFKKSTVEEFEAYSKSVDPWYTKLDSYPRLQVYEIVPQLNKIPAGKLLSYVYLFHPDREKEKVRIKISGYRCE